MLADTIGFVCQFVSLFVSPVKKFKSEYRQGYKQFPKLTVALTMSLLFQQFPTYSAVHEQVKWRTRESCERLARDSHLTRTVTV